MRRASVSVAMSVLLLNLLVASAHAHHVMDKALPQTFLQGLLSGLGHPLIGLDHAAFIICAGFFLALTERGLMGIAAMVGGSLMGAALFQWQIALPWGEALVALSVVLVAVMLFARRVIATQWLLFGLVIAGLFHGYAYGESIFGAESSPLGAYLLGFSLIQCVVAGAAWFAHRRLRASRHSLAVRISRVIAVGTGTIGAAFLMAGIVSG
jgi:urease accessory protein